MNPPAALVQLVEPWSQLYGDSKLLQTLIVFAHIAALVFAGGLAVTLDRGTLRAARGDAGVRARQLEELGRAHRLVIAGLVLSVVSGVLLFAADLGTYFGSPIFWTKAAFILLLLSNGFMMTRTEAGIRTSPDAEAGWKRLRFTAGASLFLWFATAFVGVALVNAV
jgi:hypothetical protein